MSPWNPYSLAAALFVAGATYAFRPSGLAIAGLIVLAIAVHMVVWNPERDEVFADDWVELGQAFVFVVCVVIGAVLLIAAAIW